MKPGNNWVSGEERLALFDELEHIDSLIVVGDVTIHAHLSKECGAWECDFQDEPHCLCDNHDSYQVGYIATSLCTRN